MPSSKKKKSEHVTKKIQFFFFQIQNMFVSSKTVVQPSNSQAIYFRFKTKDLSMELSQKPKFREAKFKRALRYTF